MLIQVNFCEEMGFLVVTGIVIVIVLTMTMTICFGHTVTVLVSSKLRIDKKN